MHAFVLECDFQKGADDMIQHDAINGNGWHGMGQRFQIGIEFFYIRIVTDSSTVIRIIHAINQSYRYPYSMDTIPHEYGSLAR
jgi:hypothetical protein